MAKTRKYGPTTHPLAVARKKFSRHRSQAKYRNIPFEFSFETWYEWWLNHGVDKNLNVKWAGNKRLCMCRYRDIGAYEPSNVYCGTHLQNVQEAHTGKRGQNYRYGEKLYTVDEIQMLLHSHLIDLDKQYFHKNSYDKNILKLAKRFSKRFDLAYQTHRTQKSLWHEGSGGCFATIGAAAESYGISRDVYMNRRCKGLSGYCAHQIGNKRKYILQRIPHPDALEILNNLKFNLDK